MAPVASCRMCGKDCREVGMSIKATIRDNGDTFNLQVFYVCSPACLVRFAQGLMP